MRKAVSICITVGAVLLCSQLSRGDILIVRSSDAVPYKEADAALQSGLKGRSEPIRSILAKDLAGSGLGATVKPADCVVAVGTSAARWLHSKLPASNPLVYCMVNNPADAGLLQGRRTFGVTTDVAIADQLKIIAEALPRTRAVGMLYRSDTSTGREAVKAMTAALPDGWRLETIAVNEAASVGAAIESLTEKEVDVIWTSADPGLFDAASVRSLLLAGIRKKIPVWGFSTAFVRAGALLGVGVEPRAQGAQAAELLIKLMDDPASVKQSVQPPREFQIAVNLIVAQQIAVEIPETLSRRAAFVFRPE